MKTTIISVTKAIADGHYQWNKQDNDIEYLGFIPGYSLGFCLEIKRPDDTIRYASCVFIDREEDYLEIPDFPEVYDSPQALAVSASLCSYASNSVPTGRIVFRGYFDEEWIPEEHEYGYREASHEVLNLLKRYNVEGI